jgi:hypothetical protein
LNLCLLYDRNIHVRPPVCGNRNLDHDVIEWNRIMILSLCLSMISAQPRLRVC